MPSPMTIRMPIAMLVDEHKKLIPILEKGTLRERRMEAKDQRKELINYEALLQKK